MSCVLVICDTPELSLSMSAVGMEQKSVLLIVMKTLTIIVTIHASEQRIVHATTQVGLFRTELIHWYSLFFLIYAGIPYNDHFLIYLIMMCPLWTWFSKGCKIVIKVYFSAFFKKIYKS